MEKCDLKDISLSSIIDLVKCNPLEHLYVHPFQWTDRRLVILGCPVKDLGVAGEQEPLALTKPHPPTSPRMRVAHLDLKGPDRVGFRPEDSTCLAVSLESEMHKGGKNKLTFQGRGHGQTA